MSTDTHDKIRSEVERRLAIARAASPGPWMAATHTGRKDGVSLVGRIEDRGTGKAVAVFAGANVHQRANDAEHTALHDPADAIRRYAGITALLDEMDKWRHRVVEDCWHTCPAATEEREGETTCNPDAGDQCDCGLEYRRNALLALLAESLGIDTGGQP